MYNRETKKMTIVKRKISSRRKNEFFLILSLVIMCLIEKIASAPTENHEKSMRHDETLVSNLPSRNGKSETIGSPSELAWQAWLLYDGNKNVQNSGTLDSASLLRRITPKSIFIAPALTACADGYQADTMNRCVKDVNIDSQAHRGFLVERLNAIFANAAKPQFSPSSSSSSSSSSSLPTGPLQLNIPLLMPSSESTSFNREPPKFEFHNDKQDNEEKIVPSREENSKIPEKKKIPNDENSEQAIVTLYELDNPSKSSEIVSPIDQSMEIIDEKFDTIATKIADEVKEKFGPIVVEKLPDDLKIFHSQNSSEIFDKSVNNEDTSKDDKLSPTLILLLSPSKLPNSEITEKNHQTITQNSSQDKPTIKIENIDVKIPENLELSTIASTTREIPVNIENSTKNSKIHNDNVASIAENENLPINDDNYDEFSTEDSSTEIYEDDDYEDSTEFDGEILKHSEAGFTVNLGSTIEETTETTKISTIEPEIMKISRRNETTINSSDISSEVSVNHDFIRETTMIDFNTSKNNEDFSLSTISKNYETTTYVPIVTTRENKIDETKIEIGEILNIPKIENSNDKTYNIHGYFGDLIDDEKIHEKSKKIVINETENKTLDENVNTNVNSSIDTSKMKIMKIDDKLNENFDETINPVRGIEEIFEDTLKDDLSSTERSEIVETMIAASTNLDDAIITREKPNFPVIHENQPESLKFYSETTTTEKRPSEKSSTSTRHEEIYDYEIPWRVHSSKRKNPHANDEQTLIRTIDNEENYKSQANYELPANSRLETFFPITLSRDENRVKFPNYNVERTNNRVRFPSDDANSISNEYKERNRRPYVDHDEREIYEESSERNRPNQRPHDTSEKESYPWLSNDRKNDRKEAENVSQRSRVSTKFDQRTRDRSPMLLGFWNRMPLLRDPSFSYPTIGSTNDKKPRVDGTRTSLFVGKSRRGNYYREMSNHDINRSFLRNKSPIGD